MSLPNPTAIDRLFAQLRATRRKAFIPFITAGDPDPAFTTDLLGDLAEVGVSLIEVGFPFSDPIADGPVIQASYTRALDHGVKLDQVFDCVRQATSRPGWHTPIAGMVSFSIVHRRGADRFVADAQHAGFSGLIVPDLPVEEADEFSRLTQAAGLNLILLITPTTPQPRAEKILRLCSGFVYCVSVVGITGERDALPSTLVDYLARLRALTHLPLCVGFGVSRPQHVRQLREIADGVIVGSALVRRLERVHSDGADTVRTEIRQQVSELLAALA